MPVASEAAGTGIYSHRSGFVVATAVSAGGVTTDEGCIYSHRSGFVVATPIRVRGSSPFSSIYSHRSGFVIATRLAEVHGNRTHRGDFSSPPTGFEDRAAHQWPTHFQKVENRR